MTSLSAQKAAKTKRKQKTGSLAQITENLGNIVGEVLKSITRQDVEEIRDEETVNEERGEVE